MPEPTRLDRVMDERRVDLGLTWREVAVAAKVSYEALRAIRKGEVTASALTKRGIDQALRWEPGGVDAVQAGRDPVPLDVGAPGEPAPGQDERVDAILTIIAGLPARVQDEVFRQLGDRLPPRHRGGSGSRNNNREVG
ncbi:hypothetical protein [Streptomyces sp. CAU 1734]|uniref:hypothetical protein n=1 Tax=Streptomyces sp. CAU 1734 TaxID=3140360 RepID=UPI0032618931